MSTNEKNFSFKAMDASIRTLTGEMEQQATAVPEHAKCASGAAAEGLYRRQAAAHGAGDAPDRPGNVARCAGAVQQHARGGGCGRRVVDPDFKAGKDL